MNDNPLPTLPITLDIELPSVAHTERFAERLAAHIHPPMTITLSGDIGAGKHACACDVAYSGCTMPD